MAPTEPSCFATSVDTPWGYKAGVVAPAQPTSSRMISYHSSTSFNTAKKKDENREIDLKNKRELLNLRGVISLSLLFHGGVDLAHIGGHARAPAKPRESEVYDRDRISYLSCARGSYISCSRGDTLWRAQHSTSGDLVCHHINFSSPYCSPIAWSYISWLLLGSSIWWPS
jgi:hypothetical protein